MYSIFSNLSTEWVSLQEKMHIKVLIELVIHRNTQVSHFVHPVNRSSLHGFRENAFVLNPPRAICIVVISWIEFVAVDCWCSVSFRCCWCQRVKIRLQDPWSISEPEQFNTIHLISAPLSPTSCSLSLSPSLFLRFVLPRRKKHENCRMRRLMVKNR